MRRDILFLSMNFISDLLKDLPTTSAALTVNYDFVFFGQYQTTSLNNTNI